MFKPDQYNISYALYMDLLGISGNEFSDILTTISFSPLYSAHNKHIPIFNLSLLS